MELEKYIEGKLKKLDKLRDVIIKKYKLIYSEEYMEECYIDSYFDEIKTELKKGAPTYETK